MTFKITVLGNGAALPMAGKHHSAHALNIHEQYYLVDCGEGTQTRLVECGINPLKINAIFITHLHGDHLYGLFPLISTLGLMGRKTPLAVYAPHPLGELIETLDRLLGEHEGFAVEFHPVNTRHNAMIYENSVMEVWTIPLRHRVPTAGYLFREKKPGLNIRKEMVDRYGLSIKQIVAAKRGEPITLDMDNLTRADAKYNDIVADAVIPNSALTYIPYTPRAYAYCSDTLYSAKVAELVSGVDLLYHEATFAAADKALAVKTGHSTTQQAANVALKAGVKHLLTGHFSGRYKDFGLMTEESRAIFPNTDTAVEGQTYEIKPTQFVQK